MTESSFFLTCMVATAVWLALSILNLRGNS